jgi:AraC-like DNA-binding protein
VALTVELDGAMVKVSIRDTGLGIPPDEQSVIFDEFRQSERTTARGYGGLGLGLAICKKLIEMHGGRIWVESSGEIGGGSTFAFALPSMKETMLSDGQDLLLRREGTVLVLGERSSSGGRLRMHLKQQGFEVEELWIDERPGWLSEVFVAPPGAVVLDFPASKRGWEVLRVLKENPATRQVPVLFYSLKEDIDSGAVLEVDYLTKPVGTTELAQALERQGLIDEADQDSKTILVVDDEPGVLEMHARVVRAHLPACRVLKARNGREALAVIRRDVPDLVLLDLMMPELDGFGVLEAIHEEETTREVPIIVLTGQVLTEEDMARLNRGVTAVLGKGLFSVQETLTRMEAVLMRRQGLGSEARRVARQAMAYLHEHYSEPFSRADVAGHIGVSKGYLSRCFGEEIGLSPVAYLNRYRVRMAKALLAEGDRSVTEVAMVVGFSSVAHFSRLFRREVGIPPSAYQRRHRNR